MKDDKDLWQRLKALTTRYPAISKMIAMADRGEITRESLALSVAITLLEMIANEGPVKP